MRPGTTDQVNLLAIGDCNYDGFFNNFDIDCLIDLMLLGCTESFHSGGGESSFMESSVAGDDWEHFFAVVDWLRTCFGETCR
ncbi:MAG: hypothetical protein HRU75_12860 [Planctomycetia bacterium]|nr:MAG: hypothetical protein HRU75_12860 [Planctomycetia bacterium]